MSYQFKAKSTTASKRQRAAGKTNATGTKLPTLPALKGSKKKGKGKRKNSRNQTIDYQDLAPGVRVTQTPGM